MDRCCMLGHRLLRKINASLLSQEAETIADCRERMNTTT